MKSLIAHSKRNLNRKAIISICLVAICIYGVFRGLFFEFPMTWTEEFLFFTRTFLLIGLSMIVACFMGMGIYHLIRQIGIRVRAKVHGDPVSGKKLRMEQGKYAA